MSQEGQYAVPRAASLSGVPLLALQRGLEDREVQEAEPTTSTRR